MIPAYKVSSSENAALNSTPVVSSGLPFRVLYLYAGKKRNKDVAECLHILDASHGVNITMTEVDIIRGGSDQDVTRSEVWEPLMEKTANGDFDCVILPPLALLF